jgi:putative SOS response-associated peptidase YedK
MVSAHLRWGLVPWWWSKPLKELRAATFNARAETVESKPFFRDAFKRSRCLIPASWARPYPRRTSRSSRNGFGSTM